MALIMRVLRSLPKSACFRMYATRTLPMAPTLQQLSPHHQLGVVKFWGHVRAASSVVEQRITDFGAESITEGTLQAWKKKVGDFVKKDEVIALIETDKVVVDMVAAESGTIKAIHAEEDDNVEINQLLLTIEVGAQTQPATAEAPKQASPADATTPVASAPSEPVAPAAVPTPVVDLAAPGLRAAFARLAALRMGLAPIATPGQQPSAAPAPTSMAKSAPAVAVTGSEGRTERRLQISGMRKRVHMRLKETQNTAALLSTFQEVDMSAFQELQSRYKDSFEKTHGFPFNGLSFLVKATGKTLVENTAVNAVIDDSTKEVVYRDYVDISVPIPSPRGPVSCVLQGVQSMSVRDIGAQIETLKANARQDKLTVDDMGGSTFGITDFSAAGGMLGTNIINPPQSAVLAAHATKQRATVIGGKVVARPIMYMSFTYDHRLIDGREAVSFLCSVRDKLEDPARMLLDL